MQDVESKSIASIIYDVGGIEQGKGGWTGNENVCIPRKKYYNLYIKGKEYVSAKKEGSS